MTTNESALHGPVDPVDAERIKQDLWRLARDMDSLLKATAGLTGRHVAAARAKADESLLAAKANLHMLQDAALARTRAAGVAADEYVRENPWRAMAIGGAAGLLIGALLARCERSEPPAALDG